MPQETNLNVSPYFDDFDPEKNYQKVLFKPGYPIQARELTTLQSILQNQIEQQGKHLFQEGSVVIPGQIRFDISLPAVEIESTYTGTPVSLYFDKLLGKKLRGSSSGVLAEVVHILTSEESERNNFTLYLKYIESGGTDLNNRTFFDGETLLLQSPLTYGDLGFTIQSGEGVCNTINSNSNSVGASVLVSSGVYFVRGYFVSVKEQRILLDQYSSTPSYKIGFDVIESIVNSDEDESLFDNAKGFSNYTAPGADRLKIDLNLTKKGLLESSDNFIEIIRIENGNPIYKKDSTQYSLIRDELARRTYDESGDYLVRPFTVFIRDSLNDRTRSEGLYYKDQTTFYGFSPSEDVMLYQIGPGKAYVNGYDIEKLNTAELPAEKTRTTKTIENEVLQYDAGTSLVLNRGYGLPVVGLGTTSYVQLKDSRIGVSSHSSSGNTIGVARVYDFIPETDYVDNTSRLNLRLFDIQTYTKVGLTTNISSLSTPALIRGKRSKAFGYLTSSVSNSRLLTLYNVSGSFLENEPITINGIDDGRLINEVVDYNISDVKSIYSTTGITTFNADVVLSQKTPLAPLGTNFKITKSSSGISTVTAGIDVVFTNKIKSGDIISYASTTLTGDIIYNKVESISTDGLSFNISGITTVSGICNGSLPNSDVTVNNIIKIFGVSDSANSSLMTKLRFDNISNISLEDQEILQRRLFSNISFSNSFIRLTITEQDLYFASFDEDRFIISYSDGSIEPMRIDKYDLDTTGKILTFYGLTKSSGIANVITTVKNVNPSHKIKKLNKSSSLVVDRSSKTSSGIGTTTLKDGLTYSNLYGTRVQDDEICLNVPDVVRVLAIFESADTEDPKLPKIQLTAFTGLINSNQDFIIGEQIVGNTSGAVALVVNRYLSDQLEYVYLNDNQFSLEETVTGEQSNVSATVINLFLTSSRNITSNFYLDDGQRSTFYDYSRIVRKEKVEPPTKKLKIIFQNYTIDSGDTGEFTTVNSYPTEGFKYDVPIYENSRSSDYIDIRPRVSEFNSNVYSPFEFLARRFDGDGQYSKYTLCPNENIKITYSYYLPRIDLVYLNPGGTFSIARGIPNEVPVAPQLPSNALDIAKITIPPYVFDVENIKVDISQHNRYRMSDISLLEDRIDRLEKYTTLSMLESKTENYSIKDASTGLDRFKSGFFVDNFSSHLYHDLENPLFRCAIDESSNTLRPLHYTTQLDLQLGSESIAGFAGTFLSNSDQSYPTDLGSSQVKKTGDLITLNYSEVLYSEQKYATTSEYVTPYLIGYWEGNITLRPSFDNWIDEKLIVNKSTITTTKILGNDLPLAPVISNNIDNIPIYSISPKPRKGIPSTEWVSSSKDTSNDNLLKNNKQQRNSNRTNWSRNKHLGVGGKYNKNTIEIISTDSVDKKISQGVNGKRTRLGWDASSDQRYGKNNRKIIDKFLPPDAPKDYKNKTRDKKGRSSFYDTSLIPKIKGKVNTNIPNDNGSPISDDQIISESTQTTESHYSESIYYLRSRNIEFDISLLKPRCSFAPYFEHVDISNYVTPKLLEVRMVSGTFQVGETVETDPHFTSSYIKFRLCSPNHRTGPYNSPTDVYTLNPYNQTFFESAYSQSSTLLNVDTRSLQLSTEDFSGLVSPGMPLIGKTSGAVARVTDVRLVSDNTGRLIGSFFVPDPSVTGNPKWINTENTFSVVDVDSSAATQFTSSGRLNITERNIVTTRNIIIKPVLPPPPPPSPSQPSGGGGGGDSGDSRAGLFTQGPNNTNSQVLGQYAIQDALNKGYSKAEIKAEAAKQGLSINEKGSSALKSSSSCKKDPLAQSFFVDDESGIFVTSVDIFFETKDDAIPVTLQLRPMIAGVPSNVIIPFSEVTLDPSSVNISVDGSVPTRFTFPSPVYLSGPQKDVVRIGDSEKDQSSEYAIVLLSYSTNYKAFISRLGDIDISSQTRVSTQPTLGSLFKSQNGSTWNPFQLEDLKYNLYRASFETEGIVRFFNPKLSVSNEKSTVTSINSFVPLSKTIIVGLGSTGYNPENIVPGVTLSQNSATGKLVAIAGSVSQAIVTNVGVGYSIGTYSNILLETETGYGRGVVATIGVTTVGISTITITSGGFGYKVGDSVKIPRIGNLGYGGKATITSIGSSNSFIIDEVQGSFSVGISTINYVNSSGTITSVGLGVTISSIVEDQYNDGLHMKVIHNNHGMHSSENYVKIEQFRPTSEEINSTLSAELLVEDTTITLQPGSGIGFTYFEGSSVSATNPGYVIIGNEVIGYTSVTGDVLVSSSVLRGIDGTPVQSYNTNSPVFKYEFNGISLRRINKVHNFAEVDLDKHPIDLDSYYIKIDTSDTDFDGVGIGSNRTNSLYFNKTIQSGRAGTILSNNIQYEVLSSKINNIVPSGSTMTSRIRTFTGTSISGNEKSFVDAGYQDLPLNARLYFQTPRIICSDINEQKFITESPQRRSFSMDITMATEDERVSPVIDLIPPPALILTSNLLNSPIGLDDVSLYANSEGVRSSNNDPHSSIYVSKLINLAIPANSIKVILSANKNDTNDIRVLYKIYRPDSTFDQESYELFPGYSNYKLNGIGNTVIDKSLSDGSSDFFVNETNDGEFKEYTYTIDGLPDFIAFGIKIVMAGTNQASPPLLSQLRAIATALPRI
jgi:hypothetical protein